MFLWICPQLWQLICWINTDVSWGFHYLSRTYFILRYECEFWSIFVCVFMRVHACIFTVYSIDHLRAAKVLNPTIKILSAFLVSIVTS